MRTAHPALTARHWDSPIGRLLLAANEQALCGVWFVDQTGIPDWVPRQATHAHHPVLDASIGQLQAYFQRKRTTFDLPLDWSRGTVFQRSIWQALLTIPFGQTTSYSALAQAVGRPQAVRAVGGAVGRNPLGIILPCHRVVGRNGALTGYTGGLERKIALLALESS